MTHFSVPTLSVGTSRELEIAAAEGKADIDFGIALDHGSDRSTPPDAVDATGQGRALLWTQGNAPSAALDGRAYYKEGKGIPAPLLLKRFAGHGAWNQACQDVMGLSKMNWNNDYLYDRLPVTMAYAQVLAQVIKRMPRVLPHPYQFRLFM